MTSMAERTGGRPEDGWEMRQGLRSWVEGLPAGALLGFRQDAAGSPKFISYCGERGLITIGPNRSGKGVSSAAINMICHRGSLAATDPKAEHVAMFAHWRSEVLGQRCWVFDPLHVVPDAHIPFPKTLNQGRLRAGFNPIDMVRRARNPVAEAKMIAAALVPIVGQNPFWPISAQLFLAAYILFVALDPDYPHPRTLASLWRDIMESSFDGLTKLVEVLAESEVGGFTRAEARSFLDGVSDTTKGYLKTLKSEAGQILDDPDIMECLSYTSLDFGEMQRTPTSVFFVLPGWASQIYAGLFRLWLACMFKQVEQAGLREPGDARPRTLFLFDEFATLGKSDTTREALPRMPGYGVVFWLIVQDFNQLKSLYGDVWETFISNAGVIQVIGGMPDLFTAEYLSKMTGTSTVESVSVSDNLRPDGGSFSTGFTGRPLLFPHEISFMNAKPEDRLKELLIFAGRGVALASRLVYYTDFTEFMYWQRENQQLVAKLKGMAADGDQADQAA